MSISIGIIFYLIILNFQSNVDGILGGHNIRIEEAPYQVSYGDVCGGTLIHRLWALTAAHCGTEQTFIRIGSKRRLSGLKVAIVKHILHPSFGAEHQFDFDIQLLRLRRKVHLYKKVFAVKIRQDEGADNDEILNSIDVSGWGYSKEKGDYSDILQQVRLHIVPLEECQKVDRVWYNHTLTSRMFCAGGLGMDACQGDSGGGAIFKSRLVGISSFGFGCGRNIPGVYTKVTESRIRGWIRHYTGV